MSVTLQQLSDCGLNPFAMVLLYESWNEHAVSPRMPVKFRFRDCIVSIEPDPEAVELAKRAKGEGHGV